MRVPNRKMNDPTRRFAETKKLKQCAYPGCTVQELMVGRGKYCSEHRKEKYRYKAYRAKKVNLIKQRQENSVNQVIDYSVECSETVRCRCALEGCGNEFDITILPRIYVYPKYCEEHRNEYKRNLFMMKQGHKIVLQTSRFEEEDEEVNEEDFDVTSLNLDD